MYMCIACYQRFVSHGNICTTCGRIPSEQDVSSGTCSRCVSDMVSVSCKPLYIPRVQKISPDEFQMLYNILKQPHIHDILRPPQATQHDTPHQNTSTHTSSSLGHARTRTRPRGRG